MSKLKRFDICIGGDFPDKDDQLTCDDGEFADGEVAQDLYDALSDVIDIAIEGELYLTFDIPALSELLAKARGES